MISQPPHPTRAPIPRYHSKTAYSFQPEESDAILEASAYHRKDFGLAVIWFPPRTHDNVVTSILSAFHEPTTALGVLDKLPLELINQICLQLDMASLFRLRQTNARARQILSALHEFRIVTTHALNPLCALLRTRSALSVTLQDFYHLLCTRRCSLCGGEYGDLVYLPTWIRCCSHCLRRDVSEIRVTTAASVKRVLQLSKGSLGKLPKLTTLPGIYTMEERPRLSRVTIVPTQSTLSAYREENAGAEPTQGMINKLVMRPILAFMACCALPSYNPQTGQIENGVSCAGCQVALQNSIISYQGNWAGDIRDMVYSREGFLEHFVWCEQAQILWLGSNRGTIKPPGLPYTCRKGGFFKVRE